MAPATSPRSNKIKTTTGPVRFTIQLQFIYSIYQTLYHWPGRGITPAFRTENSRKLALPVRLQDFNTSPGHRSWKLELLLCLVFLLSVPLLRPWVRGDGVGYYAFLRAPLFEQSFDFTHDYQHASRLREVWAYRELPYFFVCREPKPPESICGKTRRHGDLSRLRKFWPNWSFARKIIILTAGSRLFSARAISE